MMIAVRITKLRLQVNPEQRIDSDRRRCPL